MVFATSNRELRYVRELIHPDSTALFGYVVDVTIPLNSQPLSRGKSDALIGSSNKRNGSIGGGYDIERAWK